MRRFLFYGIPLDIIVWDQIHVFLHNIFHRIALNLNNQCFHATKSVGWLQCELKYMIEHPESIQFHHHINLNTKSPNQSKNCLCEIKAHSLYMSFAGSPPPSKKKRERNYFESDWISFFSVSRRNFFSNQSNLHHLLWCHLCRKLNDNDYYNGGENETRREYILYGLFRIHVKETQKPCKL